MIRKPGDSGAVHSDKGSRGTLRPFVDRTRDQFPASTGFAGDQNRGVRGGNLGYRGEYRTESARSSDDLLEHRCPIYFFT
jgi:hypothetical protein